MITDKIVTTFYRKSRLYSRIVEVKRKHQAFHRVPRHTKVAFSSITIFSVVFKGNASISKVAGVGAKNQVVKVAGKHKQIFLGKTRLAGGWEVADGFDRFDVHSCFFVFRSRLTTSLLWHIL